MTIDPSEAAEIAVEAMQLINHLQGALRKDADGVVRLDPVEGKKLVKHLLGLSKSIALALLD
jgi:hypothetical protein